MNDTAPAGLPAELTQAAAISDLLHPKRELAPSLRIMLDPQLYEQVKRLGGIMSRDLVFTPRHLQNKAEACFTVISMAINSNLDPHFVARCTYQTPGGSIGFEGKLVQAILEQSGRFIGAPEIIYSGDWTKVLGKFERATSQKGNEYVKPTWGPKEADGLGVIVSWKVKGEETPRVWPGKDEPFYLTQCFPLNSPLWATDPRTQIRYLALRRFADGAAPGILGGMPFDTDELLDASERALDVTPPRPTRADYKDPADLVNDSMPPTMIDPKATPEVEVDDSTPEPFEVIDMTGNVTEHSTVESVVAAYQAAMDEAEKVGEAALTTVWDNNQGLMRVLDERGHGVLTEEMSRNYGQRRQAAAAREAAAKEAEAKTPQAKHKTAGGAGGAGQPAQNELRGNDATESPGAETASTVAADTAPGSISPRAGAEPADDDLDRRTGPAPVEASAAQSNGRTAGSIPATGAKSEPAQTNKKPPPPKAAPAAQPGLGLGVPASEGYECPPIRTRDGQYQWRVWVVSSYLPEIRKAENRDDLMGLLDANAQHEAAARKAVDVADLKELDAGITKKWDEIFAAEAKQ